MSFSFSNVRSFLTNIFTIDFTSKKVRQRLITYIFTSIGIAAFTVFGLDAFLRGVPVFGTVLLVCDVFTVAMFFYLYKTDNVVYAANGIVIILFSVCLFLIFDVATYDRTAPMWLYVFPPTALFALGHRKGLSFNIVLVVITALLMALHPKLVQEYNFFYLSRYFATLCIVILLSYVFEYAREKTFQALEKAHQAEQLAKAKGDFLANMSHELRTPMNAILGFSKIIQSEITDEKHKGYLKKLDQSSHALMAIIDDILDYSDLEKGRFKLNEESFSLNELVDTVSEFFSCDARVKGIKFIVNKSNVLPDVIETDRTCLKKILFVLIDNAVKYTDAGTVSFGVEVHDASEGKVKLCFSVKDTGRGMASEELSSLFECFSQSDSSSTRNVGGLGLGLSLAQKLTNLLDGHLIADSIPGEGSTFKFSAWFTASEPQASVAVDEKLTESSCEPDEVVETVIDSPAVTEIEYDEPESLSEEYLYSKLSGSRWLIAEDNAINRMVIEEFLDETGVEMVLTENGKEALEAFKQQPFDAVLTDIQMPVMDGFGLTAAIRELPEGKTIPIISVTANSMQGYREQCLAAGMSDYLKKPVDQDELYKVMIKHLSQSKTESSEGDALSRVVYKNHFELDLFSAILSGLDVSKALRQVGGNEKLLRTMLISFEKEYANADQQLMQELKKNAESNALRLVHTIKGLAGSIAAQDLVEKAVLLEQRMKSISGNISLHQINEEFDAFANALRLTCDMVAAWQRTEHEEKTVSDEPEKKQVFLSNEEIDLKLRELSVLLSENNMQAKEVLETLSSGISDNAHNNVLQQMMSSITSFKFEDARQSMSELESLCSSSGADAINITTTISGENSTYH